MDPLITFAINIDNLSIFMLSTPNLVSKVLY
jgi:hypothetical protein